MRIKAAESSSIHIAVRDAPGGAFLPGVLFGVLAALPWLMPEPDAVRAMWSFLLAAVAVALMWAARPRVRTLVLENAAGAWQAVLDAKRRGPIERFTLTGTEHEGPARRANQYRLTGELRAGGSVTILESTDPAEVLADLRILQARRETPLEPGWGLDAPALALILDEPNALVGNDVGAAASAKGRTIELDVQRSQREAATSVFVGAAGTTLIIAAVVGRRLRHHQTIAPLSIVLPALLVGFMLLIAVWIRARKVVVAVGSSLVVERRRFGRAAERERYELSELRGAWPVGPARGEIAHILVATRRGPFALPCSDTKAAELLEALSA
ncbi:MAG TPA: hypothetical protein VF989_05105 [Polyangiaceae bacterium]